MKIAIRVDVSSQIGAGHFMRCLTLADSLKSAGGEVLFLCASPPQEYADMLATRGHGLTNLETGDTSFHEPTLAHSHWLKTGQLYDARETIKALGDDTWDWIVVDHYALDEKWESAVRTFARNIFVIDDIADRNHYCDLLLDQNFYVDADARYVNKIPRDCILLLGPKYALLRKEFRELRKKATPRNTGIKRIIIMFGGSDVDDCTGRTIDVLSGMDISGIHIDVVVGEMYPKQEHTRALCERNGFSYYVQTTEVGELMVAADLAIGASGSATWERCCLGLPSLMFAIADNQIPIAEGIEKLGAGKYLGTFSDKSLGRLGEELSEYLQDSKKLHDQSAKAMEIVDGLGVDRVTEQLFI